MSFPFNFKKEWQDKRDLSQVVGPGSCFVIKEGKKLLCACNRQGRIILEEVEIK